MDKMATVGFVTAMMVISLLIDWWLLRRINRQSQEIARLRRFLSERQRELADARDEARATQRALLQARALHDQAAQQRDTVAVELALLRDRYVEQAGAYRHLLISRLADGLRHIKFGVN